MRRIAVVSLVVAAAGLLGATPASATCFEHYNDKTTGIRSGSCAPPGGPVTSYTCWRDTCVYY